MKKMTPEVQRSLQLLLEHTDGALAEFKPGLEWLEEFLAHVEEGRVLASAQTMAPSLDRSVLGNLAILGVLNVLDPQRNVYRRLKGSDAVRVSVNQLDAVGGYSLGFHASPPVKGEKMLALALTRPM